VERSLVEVRSELRALPASYGEAKTATDRQKLLVSTVQEYVRHLTDAIRGEYSGRVLVKHASLRLFTKVLKKFDQFKAKVGQTAPKFDDSSFVTQLASQIEQLRGRELPGFMSSQAFYLCMSQYVDLWNGPMRALVEDVRAVTLEVCTELAQVLLAQFPGMRDALRVEIESILEKMSSEAHKQLLQVIAREQDPFTLNDYLEQRVNKIRFDRFSQAVDQCFEEIKSPVSKWPELKEEIFTGMRDWYRSTHCVSAQASAQDMSGIMEAYWQLAAKRFVDGVCMLTDQQLLNRLPVAVQDVMYRVIRDDTHLQRLFAESSELVGRRQELEQRRDRLLQASAKLTGVSPPPLPSTNPSPSPAISSSGPSAVGGGGGRMKESLSSNTSTSSITNATNTASTMSFSVPMGEHGLGLVLVTDTDPLSSRSSSVVVKGFRALPDGALNPSKAAGLQAGDKIVAINGTTPADSNEAITLMKRSKGLIRLEIIRS